MENRKQTKGKKQQKRGGARRGFKEVRKKVIAKRNNPPRHRISLPEGWPVIDFLGEEI